MNLELWKERFEALPILARSFVATLLMLAALAAFAVIVLTICFFMIKVIGPWSFLVVPVLFIWMSIYSDMKDEE